MPIITLPDGNNLEFSKKVTGLEVAEKISKSLAKQALVMSVDGELKDLFFLIEKNSSVKIFTAKDPEGLKLPQLVRMTQTSLFSEKKLRNLVKLKFQIAIEIDL